MEASLKAKVGAVSKSCASVAVVVSHKACTPFLFIITANCFLLDGLAFIATGVASVIVFNVSTSPFLETEIMLAEE